jgi:uncharacterized protein YdhG (YjbR/CyaY superfamily)
MPSKSSKPAGKAAGKAKPANIPEYIDAAPPEARAHLRGIYAVLKKAAPKAAEAIKWRVPVFEENRILFAFGAFKDHLNFMPTIPVMEAFRKDLAKFKTGKGTVQLPYDRPLPKALIRKMALLRVKELREKDVKWM